MRTMGPLGGSHTADLADHGPWSIASVGSKKLPALRPAEPAVSCGLGKSADPFLLCPCPQVALF